MKGWAKVNVAYLDMFAITRIRFIEVLLILLIIQYTEDFIT